MAGFLLDPKLSKSVIVSETYKCVSEVLSTVSMLSLGGTVFSRPKEKSVHADTARMNFARGDFAAAMLPRMGENRVQHPVMVLRKLRSGEEYEEGTRYTQADRGAV